MKISDDNDFHVGIVAPTGEIIEHSTDWDSAREAATSMGEFFASPAAALQPDETPVDAARTFVMQGLQDLENDDMSKMPLTLTAAAFVVIHSLSEDDAAKVRAVLIANYEEKLSILCFNTLEQYRTACDYYLQNPQGSEDDVEDDGLGTPPTPTLH